jgi:hypothetical protein
MAKMTWNEYALKEAVKTIKGECALHSNCKKCPLVDKETEVCIFDRCTPDDIDTDKIYEDKEY